MKRFLLITSASLLLSAAIYAGIVFVLFEGEIKNHYLFSPTPNLTLNASLSKRNESKKASSIIIGTSVALQNIDTQLLSKQTGEKWHTFAAHSLKCYTVLGLVDHLKIKNKTVLFPISTPELSYINSKSQKEKPQFQYSAWNISNLKTLLLLHKMTNRGPHEPGNIHVNEFGNILLEKNPIHKQKRRDEFSSIQSKLDSKNRLDTLNFRVFVSNCDSVAHSNNLSFILPILPFKLADEQMIELAPRCSALEKYSTERVRIINCHLYPLSDEYFMDSHHYTMLGAKKFTEYFSEILKDSI